MSTPLTPPPLEVVLQGLHESEIRCGIQNEPPAGGIRAGTFTVNSGAGALRNAGSRASLVGWRTLRRTRRGARG